MLLRKYWYILWIFIILVISFYKLTGFFVVQPIGAIPEWITIWYLRYETNLPFISSPDSISNSAIWSVSLLGRWMALSSITELIQDKIIARFPYSEFLYLQSTDGATYWG